MFNVFILVNLIMNHEVFTYKFPLQISLHSVFNNEGMKIVFYLLIDLYIKLFYY